MKNKPVKLVLVFGIIFLFIASAVTPMVLGFDSEIPEKDRYFEKLTFACYDDCGSSKLAYYKEYLLRDSSDNVEPEDVTIPVESPQTSISGGLMDSAWPMKCHDLRHTAQSPYSTADNPGVEKWRFYTDGWVEGGSVIGSEGTIYFGSFDHYLYALNPNGTLKWKYNTGDWIWSTPAIADDGTMYVTSFNGYLHALYPNGTKKWRCSVGSTTSSPAIAEDGTIYLGTLGNKIYAVNPNGTKKWQYTTGYKITSDPAIGDDGTVYIGSGDTYLYALYPNGTLHWRFKTGDYVKGHPSIANDGTIYIGSWDDYLYALYPNGTMKWKVGTSWGTSASASIDDDGTIYVGTNRLRAIYPNGTLKWSFNLGTDRCIGHASPAISADGTIYVGTMIGEGAGGEIIAVNPDGIEKWRKMIATDRVASSPCIAEDGTVYIGSSSMYVRPGYAEPIGYLHAFGPGDMKKIEITKPEPGKLYLFGREIMSTPRGNTVIIGDIDVKFRVYSEDEIEGGVRFYIDDSHQCTYTEPPFEWTLDERLDRWGFGFHTVKVVANYRGGCEWTEEMKILFFHR